MKDTAYVEPIAVYMKDCGKPRNTKIYPTAMPRI
jgi:hypothetical protein